MGTFRKLILTTLFLVSLPAAAAECVKSKPATYSREANIPLWIDSSGDNAHIFFTNVLDGPMTLEVELIASDGSTYTGPTSIGGAFSVNPTNAGGANLAGGATGFLSITANTTFTFGTGKVVWTAEECLQDSLMISINQTQSQQTSVFRLNGGKPL